MIQQQSATGRAKFIILKWHSRNAGLRDEASTFNVVVFHYYGSAGRFGLVCDLLVVRFIVTCVCCFLMLIGPPGRQTPFFTFGFSSRLRKWSQCLQGRASLQARAHCWRYPPTTRARSSKLPAGLGSPPCPCAPQIGWMRYLRPHPPF